MKLKFNKILKWGIFGLLLVTPLIISSKLKADGGGTYVVYINQDECIGCGACVELDPYDIIQLNGENKAAFFGYYSSADVEQMLFLIYQVVAEDCPMLCFTFFSS